MERRVSGTGEDGGGRKGGGGGGGGEQVGRWLEEEGEGGGRGATLGQRMDLDDGR